MTTGDAGRNGPVTASSLPTMITCEGVGCTVEGCVVEGARREMKVLTVLRNSGAVARWERRIAEGKLTRFQNGFRVLVDLNEVDAMLRGERHRGAITVARMLHESPTDPCNPWPEWLPG